MAGNDQKIPFNAVDWSKVSVDKPAPIPASEVNWDEVRSVSTVASGIKRGTGNVISSVGSALRDVSDNSITRGIEDFGQGIVERNPAEVTDIAGVLGKPGTFAKQALSEQVPQFGLNVAGIAAGAAAGTAIAPGPGTVVGGILGGLLPTFAQEYGGIRQEQRAAGIDNKGRALAGALPATALELAGPEAMAFRGITKSAAKVATNTGLKAGESRLKYAGKEALKNAGIEGATEVAQTGLERYGAEQDLTGRDATQDYVLSGLAGSIAGGGFGGAAAATTRREQPPEVDPNAGPLTRGVQALTRAPLTPELDPQAEADRIRAADAADARAAQLYAERDAEERRRQLAEASRGLQVSEAPLRGVPITLSGPADESQGMSVAEPEFITLEGPADASAGMDVTQAQPEQIDLTGDLPRQQQPDFISVPLTEAAAQKQAQRRLAAGDDVEVIPHPRVEGRFAVATFRTPREALPAPARVTDAAPDFQAERAAAEADARASQREQERAAEVERRASAMRGERPAEIRNGDQPFKSAPAANAFKNKRGLSDYEVRRLDKGQFVLSIKNPSSTQEAVATQESAPPSVAGAAASNSEAPQNVEVRPAEVAPPSNGSASPDAPGGASALVGDQRDAGRTDGNLAPASGAGGPETVSVRGGEPEPAPALSDEPVQTRNRAPHRSGKTASWVIRDKATGAAVLETFNPDVVRSINADRYEAVAIQDHLADLNRSASPVAPTPPTPLTQQVQPENAGAPQNSRSTESAQAVQEQPVSPPQDQGGTPPPGAESSQPTPAAAPSNEPPAAEPVVEHITAKGKRLTGYVRPLTEQQAKAIDPYAFRKGGPGNWFVRKERADGTASDGAARQNEPAPSGAAAAPIESAERSAPPNRAAALRAAGEKYAKQAAEDLGRDRNTNTARRARIAEGAEADARARESIGRTMMALADAIERGEAPKLSAVTTRAQVEELEKALRQGMAETDRPKSYAEKEASKGRAPVLQDIYNAKLPAPSWNTGGADQSRLLAKIDGMRGARAVSRKIRQGAPNADLVASLKRLNLTDDEIRSSLGWWNVEAIQRSARLARVGIKTTQDLTEALKEYVRVRAGRRALDPIKEAERALVGQKVGVDFFPTPEAVAERMAQEADIKAGDRVLEPSAGNGNLADAAKSAGATVDAAEISDALRKILEAKGYNLVARDFMEYTPTEKYDAVLMNPPFSDRKDAEHIRHAYGMLKPGGRLVAIAGEGVFIGSDRKAQDFRSWLDGIGATIEQLPANTFRDNKLLAQTGANARLIVAVRPAEAGVDADAGTESAAAPQMDLGETPESKADAARVKAVADRITQSWKNAPPIRVLSSLGDPTAPQAARDEHARRVARGAKGSPRGFVYRGAVYLVADRLPNDAQIARTLLHESVGHLGLRGTFGADLHQVLRGVANMRRAEVEAKLKEYGFDDTPENRLRAAEEVLARMAESNPKLGFVRSAIAAIRTFLRKLGVQIRASDDELIRDFIAPARRYVQRGQRQETASPQAAPAFQNDGELTPEDRAAQERAKRQLRGVTPNATQQELERAIAAQERTKARLKDLKPYPAPSAENPDFAITRDLGDFWRAAMGREGLFKFGQPAEGVTDLQEISDAVAPGYTFRVTSEAADGKLTYLITTPAGRRGSLVREPDGVLQLHIGQLKEGEAEGAPIYMAVNTWAARNGLKALPDRQGLTRINKTRRTEMMQSSALRDGGTNHLLPDASQYLPHWREKANAKEQAFNTGYLFLKGAETTFRSVPLLDRVRFNFDSRRFEDARGREFTGTDFDTLLSQVPAGKAGVGSGTAKRAVVTASALREISGPRLDSARQSWQRLADDLSSARSELQGDGTAGSGLVDDPLNKVLYDLGTFKRQTETPEFKRWFGDSKVVDAEGKPLVVYHGTTASFDSFDPATVGKNFDVGDQKGFFFSSTVAEPNLMAGGMSRGKESGGNIMPVYLSLQNPLVIKLRRGESGNSATQYLDDYKQELMSAAEEGKRDGIIVTTAALQDWPSHSVYVAFRPNQIKSAIGNRGTFDPNEDRIDFDLSAPAADLRQRVGDLFSSRKTFNWWHNSVGTQYHKAQVDKDFGRVFNRGQQFLSDVSRYALGAADLASDILPRLERFTDLGKTGAGAKDLKPVADAVFTGTLTDERVYTDAELKNRFNLNPKQIRLYRQTRAAISRSLDDLAVSEMVRLAQAEKVPSSATEAASRAATPEAARDILVGALPEGSTLKRDLDDRVGRAASLKDKGYAPLMRFGRYTVGVKGKNGEQRYFGMFEREADAARMEREMQATYPGDTVTRGVMSQEAFRLFRGLSPDTLEVFANAAGVDPSDAFQQYLKLAINNRSAMKRLIERKGIAGYSPDLKRVLAQFILSNARAASGNLHRGEMLREVEAIDRDKGDVKDEAVRLMNYLQDPQEEAQKLRGYLFINFLGGSIASAAVNMTQPLTMTLPYLSQWGAAKAASAVRGGIAAGLHRPISEPALRAAMDRAAKEGIVEPHQIFELQGAAARATTDWGAANPVREAWSKVAFTWGSLFSLAEAFNRRLTFAAAFNVGRGLSQDQLRAAGVASPYEFATKAVYETQGVYNRGNRPNWARGAIGATVFTFKQFGIAYLEFLKRLPTRERALALAILAAAAGVNGLPFADDLDDLIDTLAERLGYSWSTKQEREQFVASILGRDAAQFVTSGISAGLPIDVSARMGLGNLVPGTGVALKSNQDKLGEATEALGPAAGLVENIVTAAGKASSGDWLGGARTAFPLAVQNALKGVDMAQFGFYRDQRGRRVIDTTNSDAFWKGIGFQPSKVAEESRDIQAARQKVELNRVTETEIADLWAQGLFEKDQDKVNRAKRQLANWNQRNPESPIRIAPQQILGRVKKMRESRQDRFVKAAPAELRAGIRETIQQ